MLICSPPPAPPVQEYSQPRCGWPCHQRAQAGRSSPVRCPHSASRARRVGQRRGEDDHLPGTVGEHLVAAAPQLRPPGDHRGGGDGQHRARRPDPTRRGRAAAAGPAGRWSRRGRSRTGPAARPARPPRSAAGARSRQHVLISVAGQRRGGGRPGGLAGLQAGDLGRVGLVHQAFSSGEARASKQTRADGPAASRPVPLAADRSRDRSPADRRNSAATLPMACGDWRSRIWVAELAITARPRSVQPARPRRPG